MVIISNKIGKCPDCGKEIPPDARVCPYCGKKFSPENPAIVQEGKKDKTVLILVLAIALILIVPVAIAATVFVYVNDLSAPESGFNAQKTMAASEYSTDEQSYFVTYIVTSADSGIYWSSVHASWNGGSTDTITNIDNSEIMTGQVNVGDYFSIEVGQPGSYDIDLIYQDNIIWTCPTVTLS